MSWRLGWQRRRGNGVKRLGHEERLGILLPADLDITFQDAPIPDAILYSWGRQAEPETMARELYAGLRSLDNQNCTVILCPLPPAEGIGAAIGIGFGRLRARRRRSSRALGESPTFVTFYGNELLKDFA